MASRCSPTSSAQRSASAPGPHRQRQRRPGRGGAARAVCPASRPHCCRKPSAAPPRRPLSVAGDRQDGRGRAGRVDDAMRRAFSRATVVAGTALRVIRLLGTRRMRARRSLGHPTHRPRPREAGPAGDVGMVRLLRSARRLLRRRHADRDRAGRHHLLQRAARRGAQPGGALPAGHDGAVRVAGAGGRSAARPLPARPAVRARRHHAGSGVPGLADRRLPARLRAVSGRVRGAGAVPRVRGGPQSAAVPRLLPAGLGLSQAGARASVYGTSPARWWRRSALAAFWFGPQWPLRRGLPDLRRGHGDRAPPAAARRLRSAGGDAAAPHAGRRHRGRRTRCCPAGW